MRRVVDLKDDAFHFVLGLIVSPPLSSSLIVLGFDFLAMNAPPLITSESTSSTSPF